MEKTTEEKLAAVLQFCDEVCPNPKDAHILPDEIVEVQRIKQFGDYSHEYIVFVGGRTIATINKDSAPREVLAAYRLLGLEARDAVQAERSRLSKRYKSRLNRLMANDAETHRIQIEVKDERIAALQAKSAALVEGLQVLKKEHGLDYGFVRGEKTVLNAIGMFIDELLDTSEKPATT